MSSLHNTSVPTDCGPETVSSRFLFGFQPRTSVPSSNLASLRRADPFAFPEGYLSYIQPFEIRQPILVDSCGIPLDGNSYCFIGNPVRYMGNTYASVSQDYPHIGFLTIDKNPSGRPSPACFADTSQTLKMALLKIPNLVTQSCFSTQTSSLSWGFWPIPGRTVNGPPVLLFTANPPASTSSSPLAQTNPFSVPSSSPPTQSSSDESSDDSSEDSSPTSSSLSSRGVSLAPYVFSDRVSRGRENQRSHRDRSRSPGPRIKCRHCLNGYKCSHKGYSKNHCPKASK